MTLSSPVDFKLVEPAASLEAEFRRFIADWDRTGEEKVPFVLELDASDFGKYVKTLLNFRIGIGIPDTFVSHSTFWLFDGSKLVAVSNLRHGLTERLKIEGGHIGYGVCPSERRKGYATAILRLTLLEAWKMGMREALITCNSGNAGSIGTILKNGGALESQGEFKGHLVNRYWIRR